MICMHTLDEDENIFTIFLKLIEIFNKLESKHISGLFLASSLPS